MTGDQAEDDVDDGRTIDVGFVHVGRHYDTGPEYGEVWECDPDCPHPDHATEDTDGW